MIIILLALEGRMERFLYPFRKLDISSIAIEKFYKQKVINCSD